MLFQKHAFGIDQGAHLLHCFPDLVFIIQGSVVGAGYTHPTHPNVPFYVKVFDQHAVNIFNAIYLNRVKIIWMFQDKIQGSFMVQQHVCFFLSLTFRSLFILKQPFRFEQ